MLLVVLVVLMLLLVLLVLVLVLVLVNMPSKLAPGQQLGQLLAGSSFEINPECGSRRILESSPRAATSSMS